MKRQKTVISRQMLLDCVDRKDWEYLSVLLNTIRERREQYTTNEIFLLKKSYLDGCTSTVLKQICETFRHEVNCRDSLGKTILCHTIHSHKQNKEHWRFFKYLLQVLDQPVKSLDSWNISALSLSVIRGTFSMVKYLKQRNISSVLGYISKIPSYFSLSSLRIFLILNICTKSNGVRPFLSRT